MTIPKFLERLKATEVRWTVGHDADEIRCEKGNCPITAVAESVMHEPFSVDCWEYAANEIEMDLEDAQAIVDAADMADDYDPALRRQLLAATVNR